MQKLLLLGFLAIAHHAHAGVSSILTPASTTLVRQATSITHPSPVAYSQPLALSYSAPIAYSYTPTYYSSPLVAPFQIPVGLFDHGSIFQIPSFIGQNPVAPPQSSGEAPAQGDAPVIEGPQQPQQPQQPSPVLGGAAGASPGVTADDDTVSVEAA